MDQTEADQEWFQLERPRRLMKAIEAHLDAGENDAALILLYTTLDILGSLDRPADALESTEEDFSRWIDTYLLQRSELRCTASDVWGFRCGMLHTLSEESRSTRAGTARVVIHALEKERSHFGLSTDELLELVLKRKTPKATKHKPERYVIVNAWALWRATNAAIVRFELDLHDDPERQEAVEHRLRNALVTFTISVD